MARILLVEDEPDQLEIRKLILEGAGHQVMAAANVVQALAACPHCEVLVLDLIAGAPRILAALPPDARVIVLTGRDLRPNSIRADRIFEKPYPSKDLLAAIAQLWTSSSK